MNLIVRMKIFDIIEENDMNFTGRKNENKRYLSNKR